MIAFIFLLLTMYLLLLLLLLWGWSRVMSVKQAMPSEMKTIGVVIPFRNEEKSIKMLLDGLSHLDYPQEKFRVILVDDHSEDQSLSIVRQHIVDKSNYYLVELSKDYFGKKNAITAGIENSKQEIVVITDADCYVNPKWLVLVNSFFGDEQTKLVFGGVRILQGRAFFSKLQSLEFSSLIGSGAASIGLGVFTMCNGANLSFLRETFVEVGGYTGNLNIASGDDEFLARKIIRKHKNSIKFLNDTDGVISTLAQCTWREFIDQRLRWAGKWKYNESVPSKLFAFLIFLFQIAFILIIALLAMGKVALIPGLMLLIFKVLFEMTFLLLINRFIKSRFHWLSFFVLQWCYPFYVMGIGLFAQGGSYSWKGRSLSHKM